ncbi:MAG: OsmC family protein [Microbacteriaceae bacterium]
MRHTFALNLRWRNTRAFDDELVRDYSHEGYATIPGHAALVTSAAPDFGGDPHLWNPEEMLMAAIAQCHLLSFLYIANRDGVEIVDYIDEVEAAMDFSGGTGRMHSVTLKPTVFTDADPALIARMHEEAKGMCVMRASMNFPIDLVGDVRQPEPTVN